MSSPRRLLLTAALGLIALGASGCGSLVGQTMAIGWSGRPVPYAGTMLETAAILTTRGKLKPSPGVRALTVVDLPLTFALDTAWAPIALPWFLIHGATKDRRTPDVRPAPRPEPPMLEASGSPGWRPRRGRCGEPEAAPPPPASEPEQPSRPRLYEARYY